MLNSSDLNGNQSHDAKYQHDRTSKALHPAQAITNASSTTINITNSSSNSVASASSSAHMNNMTNESSSNSHTSISRINDERKKAKSITSDSNIKVASSHLSTQLPISNASSLKNQHFNGSTTYDALNDASTNSNNTSFSNSLSAKKATSKSQSSLKKLQDVNNNQHISYDYQPHLSQQSSTRASNSPNSSPTVSFFKFGKKTKSIDLEQNKEEATSIKQSLRKSKIQSIKRQLKSATQLDSQSKQKVQNVNGNSSIPTSSAYVSTSSPSSSSRNNKGPNNQQQSSSQSNVRGSSSWSKLKAR